MHRKAQDKSRMGLNWVGLLHLSLSFQSNVVLGDLSYESKNTTQNHTHIAIRLWELQKLLYPQMDTKCLRLGKFFKVSLIKDGNF